MPFIHLHEFSEVSTPATPAAGRRKIFPTTDGWKDLDSMGNVKQFATLTGTETFTNKTLTSPTISGGTINNAAIGGTTAAAGKFTTLEATGAFIVNEAGADVDSRIEGDTDVNLVFVDASTDRVGIGTATPSEKLHVAGNVTLVDNELIRPKLRDYAETVHTEAASGATETIDLEVANVKDLTLTANCTLTFSNPPATGIAGSFTLILRQDATGSRTVTWPASVRWAGGVAPTLTTTASRTDIFTFITVTGGTIYYGFTAGLNFA